MQYCTISYYTTLCDAMLYCAILYYIILCDIISYHILFYSILFYDNRGMTVCASTIEILDVWTPKLFLGLLLQEWCVTNVIYLFPVGDQACDDIFKMWLLYYNHNATQLVELVISSPNYSFGTGGF